MILLIGVNHRYQLEGYGTDWESFYQFLSRKTEELDADLLAEEMNEECITRDQANDSVARRVSREKSRLYLFVDPDSLERKLLGIKGFKEIADELGYGPALNREESNHVERIEKEHWDKRERYWIEVLRRADFKTCIFIIGATHIQRVCNLLSTQQIEHTILLADYQA